MSASELIFSLEIGLIYGVIAIGIYLTFRVIDFPDLSCDGSFVLGTAVSSMLIKAGYNPCLALLVACLAGCIAGITTGILNKYLKITNLLSGILVAFMLYSINLHVMHGIPNIALIGVQTIFSNINTIIILSLICCLVVLLFGYILSTNFGLAIRCVGQNKILAQNGGINTGTITLIVLALSNSLIALGGALFSQHQGFADVGSGIGTVIVGFASVMIGERLLTYRSIWLQLLSCLIGSILYRVFISFALHSEVLGLKSSDLNLVTGIMIIIIMSLPRRRPC